MSKDLTGQLRERLKLKYMGNCKCGQCQLVPAELMHSVISFIEAITRSAARSPNSDDIVTRLLRRYDETGNSLLADAVAEIARGRALASQVNSCVLHFLEPEKERKPT